MRNKQKILIVEDEVAIRTGLQDVLIFHGFEVSAAETGDEGLRLAMAGGYDLILLDVMLPGVDGFSICRQIREVDKQQPIIMLTAKSSDDEIIEGLTLGADDYVAKPFSIAQLILRIQAVLRRSKANNEDAKIELSNGREIDTLNLCVQSEAGSVAFTKKEMELIQYLYANKEGPVSREELLEQVWGYGKDIELETRTVDIHIAKVRRKIETDPKHPQCLVTVRGAGYRLIADSQ